MNNLEKQLYGAISKDLPENCIPLPRMHSMDNTHEEEGLLTKAFSEAFKNMQASNGESGFIFNIYKVMSSTADNIRSSSMIIQKLKKKDKIKKLDNIGTYKFNAIDYFMERDEFGEFYYRSCE